MFSQLSGDSGSQYSISYPTCVGGRDAPPLPLHPGRQSVGGGPGPPGGRVDPASLPSQHGLNDSLAQDPHLHQVGALEVLLQDGVVRDGELPGGLVVSNDEGGVPLGGSLHPVDGQPLPQQHRGGRQQQPLGSPVLQPPSDLGLSLGSDGQPWQ